MQKPGHFPNRPSPNAGQAFGRIGKSVTDFLVGRRALGEPPAVLTTSAGLLAIALLAWLSFYVPAGLNFEFIYLFLCALVGWLGGTRPALLCAWATASLLFVDETARGGLSTGTWTFWFNGLVRLVALVSTGWMTAQVGRLTRRLEKTVRERTSQLEAEVTRHKQTADRLQEAMEIFQQVAEKISKVFWVTDPARTQVEYISPEFEKVWGESREALYRTPGIWLERVHAEEREQVSCSMSTRQVQGDYDEEYRIVRSDGAVRWVHDRAYPVKDESGAVYRIVGIAEDITERKQTERLLQAERDLGIALSSTTDLHFAMERLLEIALQLEGLECGGVYLFERETGGLQLEVHRNLSTEFIERASRYGPDSEEARLAKAGRSVYLKRERIPRTPKVLWGGEGLRALAIVPIQQKGTVLGLMNLGSYRNEEIPAQTQIGLELIASQVAGALARIRAEDSFRRSEANVRTVINNAPMALLAADARGMVTFEDGRALPSMDLKPHQHLRRPAAEVFPDFPSAQENMQRACAGEEFASTLEFAEAVFDCRYTPMPLKKGKPDGFIMVATDVTERLRLQREILEISDREQARLGQNLHDGLCQQLIGMAFKARSLERALGSQQHPEAANAGKLCELLDEAITESRSVSRGLYPIRLATHGLVPALEELATTTSERHDVTCHCETQSASADCSLTTATHLYRIAQEAVNNAIKHSGARRISIELTGSENGTSLRVHDDGKGFPSGQVGPSLRAGRDQTLRPHGANSGMGLHIMQYRAGLVGGRLELSSGPGGTLVSCVIPSLTIAADL
jgi:PAS domain S-box-containing protein